MKEKFSIFTLTIVVLVLTVFLFGCNFSNLPPVADAGQDKTVQIGDTVQLDGSGSYDPNDDALNYLWKFNSCPSDCGLKDSDISGSTSAMAEFTPDTTGTYLIDLTVSDLYSSATDQVIVTVQEVPIEEPTATPTPTPVTPTPIPVTPTPTPVTIPGPIVESIGIIRTNISFASRVTLGQVTINPATAGKVIVNFNGTCISSPGDRIVLAASDTTNWGVNDGNVGVEAYNSNVNRNPFSHTRVYNVSAGSRTFYAVGYNYVETAGTGIASVYGNLTVKFIPTASDLIVGSTGISQTNINLSSRVTLGQVSINPPASGKVIVHFDGSCISSPGDRIVLAASNTTNWGVNDGNVGVEAKDADVNQNSFSHTRVYNVTAGPRTFYAVGHNYVETAGTGNASVYGNLTVEFIPSSSPVLAESTGISRTNVNLGSTTALGQVTINPATSGKAIVVFDGSCISTPGDRIVLAAGNTIGWYPNDGNTSVEVIDSDVNQNSFSHTQVYNISAGSNTFYGVGHNYVETDGTGIASVYGSLTVLFY